MVLLIVSIMCCFAAFILISFACEIGQRFTNAFSDVDDVLGQLKWYLLPIEVQRILPIAIMYSQEPLLVKFFGNMSCSREQFKKVIHDYSKLHIEAYVHIEVLIGILFFSFSGDENRVPKFYGTS